VIVATRPASLLAALRRQWLKLGRKVQRECASTLNATRILELREAIVYMQTLRFAAKWLPGKYLADVYLATPEELLRRHAVCTTLYVTCPINSAQLDALVARMPEGSLVVTCELA
jgi:hypothetical protein